MKNFFLLPNIDNMFKFSSTLSIIISIVSALIFISVFGLIIFFIIKTVKGVKNGTIKLDKLKKQDPNFITCEYCGSSNKADSVTCEKCGASLNRK